MAIRKLATETSPLTAQLANTFNNMTPLKGERRLKASRCKYFEDLIRKGLFVGCDWATCTIANDVVTTYRGDGQHTSRVLATLPDEQFPQGLTVNITRYHLDNDIDDASTFFDLFNNPVSTRTADDRMRQIAARFPEFASLDIPEGLLTKVAKIIQTYRREANDSDDEAEQLFLRIFPARERGLYFEEDRARDFALWCYRWIDTANVRLLSKTDNELLVEMYVQWQEDEESATSLWGEIFRGDNPDLHATANRVIEMLRAVHPKTLQKKKFIEKTRRTMREQWKEFVTQEVVGA